MNEIDRQKQLETDSLQNGVLRFCESREYAKASDSKPVRNLMADALKPLAEAILQAQLALKAPGSQKLPRYGIPLLSIHPRLWILAGQVVQIAKHHPGP